jgi:hypothetical protein
MICRGLRLELVTGLGIALAAPALALAAPAAQGLATETTIQVETRDLGARTQAHVAVAVAGEDGLPATGAIVLSDHGRSLAGALLNAQGQASLVLALPAGDHALSAAYSGDATHQGSVSVAARIHALATTTPDFQISVAPASLTLTAGQSGTVIASVTPENSASLAAPMFVTLSCSGLPDQAACTFTPENVEILPNATAALTSTMVIATQKASSASAKPATDPRSSPIEWALLLPGTLALGGLAWGARRRSLWFSRLSVLAFVAMVAILGTTACNPRYNYEHHGPPINPATPAGKYTVDVVAQSSNGVTATTHSTTLALTVQ